MVRDLTALKNWKIFTERPRTLRQHYQDDRRIPIASFPSTVAAEKKDVFLNTSIQHMMLVQNLRAGHAVFRSYGTSRRRRRARIIHNGGVTPCVLFSVTKEEDQNIYMLYTLAETLIGKQPVPMHFTLLGRRRPVRFVTGTFFSYTPKNLSMTTMKPSVRISLSVARSFCPASRSGRRAMTVVARGQ